MIIRVDAEDDGMKIGDTITCASKDDLINTMFELARSGVETDFDYNDVKPRLIVTAVDKGGKHDRPRSTR